MHYSNTITIEAWSKRAPPDLPLVPKLVKKNVIAFVHPKCPPKLVCCSLIFYFPVLFFGWLVGFLIQ